MDGFSRLKALQIPALLNGDQNQNGGLKWREQSAARMAAF
jgi:hypothetical protein